MTWRLSRLLAILAGIGGTGGCALPQSGVPVLDATVYNGTKDVMQYRSPLPRDAQPAIVGREQVQGVSCSTTIALPFNPPALFYGSESVISLIPWPAFTIGAGDRGYAAAMRRARDAAGEGTLVDVRADLHTTSILSIVRRDCTEVHAAIARKPQ